MTAPLIATIHSIEGGLVKVTLEDGQTLRLPSSACEGVPKPGAEVRIIAAVLGSEDAGRQALARDILNQLLGASDK